MKPEQTHIDQIRTAFEKMQSREDLLQLLNEAKPLVYGEKAVPFDLKQLTWFANPKLGGKRYVEFKIKKKCGTPRTIHAPAKGLKALQKTLSFVLQCVFEPHKAAMGFVREKSIVDNARLHEGSLYVYNIDLKDFFPSVDQARVWKCLQLKPFNLNDGDIPSITENPILQTGIRKFITKNGENIFYQIKENKLTLVIDKKGNFKKYKERLTNHLVKPIVKPLSLDPDDRKKLQEYNEQVNNIIFEDAKRYIGSPESIKQISKLVSSRQSIANIIASLCCTEMEVERKNDAGEWKNEKRNVLPQGAPTSPVITNIICQRLDYLLSAVAKRFGLKYSRYADDITFSSMHNVYQQESDFLKEIQRIVLEQGFHIKESKTRLQKKGFRQEVTGLLVNEKVNVQQRYVKQLRMWLYYWERYGYDRAYGFFLQQYMADKGNIVKGKPDMANVIGGKLDYLKMVKGGENELYLKLKGRCDALTQQSKNEYLNSNNNVQTDAQPNKITISIVSNRTIKKPQKLLIEKVLPTGLEIPYKEEFENKPSIKKKVERLIHHNPLLTVEFLKDFKYDNNTGLKELVHKPFDLSSFNFLDVIKRTKEHPVFVSTFHIGRKSSDFKGELPYPLWSSVKRLIDSLSNEGLQFFAETNKHPIENPDLLKEIQEFKKNYRFGSEKTEYSILKELIINVAKKANHQDGEKGLNFSFGGDDTSGQFNERQLTFLPNEKIFTMRAGFFTWVPNVTNALWWIFQGILQHSNIDGNPMFDINMKKIDIEVIRERIPNESITQIRLQISDNKSFFTRNPEQLVNELKGSKPYTEYLRGIADWIVEFDCSDGKSYRLNMLPGNGQIIQLKNKVNSFKNIIVFYD